MEYSLTAIFACLTLVNFVDRESMLYADTQVIYQPSTTVSVTSVAKLIFSVYYCFSPFSHTNK